MGRKKHYRWRTRLFAALALLALAGAAWGWWSARGWRPSRAEFPVQGVLIGADDGAVDFIALRGAGAGFVYLEASAGARGRDARFARNLAAIAATNLPHGAVHRYDPCVAAGEQAANFVTIVPRDARELPPAIALDKPASACNDPVAEAALESELTTFINQVENHIGQPVVLKISPDFEAEYHIAARIERNLWLERDFLQPDYAGRPWTLWTATAHLHAAGADGPLRWVAVQP